MKYFELKQNYLMKYLNLILNYLEIMKKKLFSWVCISNGKFICWVECISSDNDIDVSWLFAYDDVWEIIDIKFEII